MLSYFQIHVDRDELDQLRQQVNAKGLLFVCLFRQ